MQIARVLLVVGLAILGLGCGSSSSSGADAAADGQLADQRVDRAVADGGSDRAVTGDGGRDGGALDTAASDGGGVTPVVVPWLKNFSLPPQDAQGFSVLTPSADSRIVYVSSTGDDATAQTYTTASPEVGADPTAPVGAIKPFKTISAAQAQARTGFPDWVLLKRGESWTRTSQLDAKSGRSASERSVLGAYGSGARPLLKTGTATGVRFWKKVRFAAVVGLEFYAHERDPDAASFVGFAAVGGPSGFWSYADDPTTPNRTILIEDCVFRFYANNVVQGTKPNEDIIVRRCQILDDYSASAHAQGMYTSDASVLLEENLFDHNGWYKQSYVALNDQAEGQATFFNHNTYFTNTHDTIFRRNLFLRASSIGTKFTANSPGAQDTIMAKNVLLDDNLYVEGEIGVSAGGNDDRGTGPRFENFLIVNNVLSDIGRARPTARSLGWGLDAIDWKGGRISGNTLIHTGDAAVTNIFAIHCSGHTSDVEIDGNIVHGYVGGTFALTIDGSPKTNVRVFDNALQLAGSQMRLIDTQYLAAQAFSDNSYYTDRSAAGTHFRVKGQDADFVSWVTQTTDTSQQVKASYLEPTRTVEIYMQSLGLPATLAAFIAEAKKQSRQNWRPAFGAAAVNRYIRAGFALSP